MGATRPARSAASKGASKTKALGAKKAASKNSDIDMDEDDYEAAPEGDDDDDSDEYVEPAADKNGRSHDNDEDDEDEHMEVDEELDEDEEIKPKKQRRRKQTNNFSIPLEEMNRLLSTRNHSDVPTEGDSSTAIAAGTELNLERLGGKDVVSPLTSIRSRTNAAGEAKRAPKKRPIKSVHKKGEMHRPENIPEIWKHSYQGPTSEDVHHVSMHQEYLQATVYPHLTSNIKDFLILTEPSDLDEYLPLLTTTRIHTRGKNIDMRTMTAEYMETTKQTGINDYYILNAGFSVWAMDWCPLPSNDKEGEANMDYVAIGGFPDTAENCIARDQLYPLGKQDAHPNMIQIWSINCNTNDQGELQGSPQTYLALCILHSYGAVFDLKWCPTGGHMDAGSSNGDLTRLGILAATFSDGTIRIFSVPEPKSLRAHLGIVTPEGSTPEPVYIEYPEPYATIRMGDICFMCINWGTSERLAAGLTNGTIAVWDAKLMLSQTKETLAEKDSEYLDPIYLPQVHDVSVRSVDWLRSIDPSVVPCILASSGYDGRIRYTDLHDIYVQIDIKTILGVSMASLCNPWAEAIIYCDFDFGGKMDQLYQESRGFRLFNAKGTIWDFSSSDYQPFVAAAISDGRVKISNPAYKAKRGYGMIQNSIYQVEEALESADGTSQELPTSSSNQMEVDGGFEKKASFKYKEGEEREYISKTAGYLSFYGANVAVQKVQWSKCFHSAAWLASGSAGGLVRIDNTMLRKEEGGNDNKISYQPEAYLLKKRIANGASIGPDGQYVPARRGRPPKEGGPRRLRKGKNAKGTSAASKSGTAKGKSTGRKGAKSKSTDDDHDSEDEEEPEAEESGQNDDDSDNDDDTENTGGQRDEDEFVGRKVTGSSNSVKRATRLSTGRLAPIFARPASKDAAASEEDDEDGEKEVEEAGEEGRQAEAESASLPSKKSTRNPIRGAVSAAATPPTKDLPTTPTKPRGRPRKNPPPVDPVSSNQTILSMMRISRPESSVTDTIAGGPKDASSAEVVMAEVLAETIATGAMATTVEPVTSASPISTLTNVETTASKTSAASSTTPKKPRGRPPKARPAVAEVTTAVTATAETTVGISDGVLACVLLSNDTAPTQATVHGAGAVSTDHRDIGVQGEEPTRQSSESAASSRASSVVPEAAPGPSGKKAAAPRMARKRKEEDKNKATNRTLTDLWGSAGKNAKDAKAKP
ncbi:hypothetical protein BGZ95_006442 [Linnemannia exigua]|uniref:WD40 repeat-like protein n=1 Tax=Linnemannia exigua TaxID=604196 RepID=A0AAD4DLJ1_9FUNG|nr:hypothetical protein BGZ95_006442 [Linnemannia exigua]